MRTTWSAALGAAGALVAAVGSLGPLVRLDDAAYGGAALAGWFGPGWWIAIPVLAGAAWGVAGPPGPARAWGVALLFVVGAGALLALAAILAGEGTLLWGLPVAGGGLLVAAAAFAVDFQALPLATLSHAFK